MANFLVATSWVTATVAASSSAAAFPATRLNSVYAPYDRPWKAGGAAPITGSHTFSGSTALVACAVYDTNFATIIVNGLTYTINRNPWDKQYKKWIPLSVTASSIAWSIPSQTLISGSVPQMGRLLFFSATTELVRNPQKDMPVTVHDPQFVAGGVDQAVYESTRAGDPFQTEEWAGLWTIAETDSALSVLLTRGDEIVTVYRNLGRDYEFGFYQRTGSASFRYGNMRHEGNPSWRQVR